MTKRNQYDGDEGNDIVKDGEHVRVPMMLCDAMQRDVAQYCGRPVQVVDAFGMPAGQKRGYCFPNTSSVELRRHRCSRPSRPSLRRTRES